MRDRSLLTGNPRPGLESSKSTDQPCRVRSPNPAIAHMGSFGDGDYSKGDNPALAWVQRGIDRHNATCANRASAAPLRLKLLALIGIRRPFDRWQEREPI